MQTSLAPFNLGNLPDYLKMRDLCALLCASPTAIRNGVKSGYLPAPVRISSRTFRWRKTDIVKCLAIPFVMEAQK